MESASIRFNPLQSGSIWMESFSIRFLQKLKNLNCFQSKKFFTPVFHLDFFILNCFQFKIFIFCRFFVNTHTIFDVCVLKKYLKNKIFWKIFLRQKNVRKKVFGGKKVRDFFSNFKNIFKILENIFWIFIFLKNNDFTFFKIDRSTIDRWSIETTNNF